MRLLRIFLGSALWQGVGAIAGVAALVALAYTWYGQTGEIAVASAGLKGIEAIDFSKKPNNNRAGEIAVTSEELKNVGRVDFSKNPANDKELPAQTIEFVLIKNKGVRAVKPSDFLIPMTIRSKGHKIMGIEPCPASMSVALSFPLVPLNWVQSGDEWKVEGALLNAGEWACAAIGFYDSFISDKTLNNFVISARIADTKLVHYDSLSGMTRGDSDFFMLIFVRLGGSQIYMFLALQATLFFATLLLFENAGIAKPNSLKYRLILVLAMVLSTGSAESLVFMSSVASVADMHLLGIVVLIVHLAFLSWCTLKTVTRIGMWTRDSDAP